MAALFVLGIVSVSSRSSVVFCAIEFIQKRTKLNSVALFTLKFKIFASFQGDRQNPLHKVHQNVFF